MLTFGDAWLFPPFERDTNGLDASRQGLTSLQGSGTVLPRPAQPATSPRSSGVDKHNRKCKTSNTTQDLKLHSRVSCPYSSGYSGFSTLLQPYGWMRYGEATTEDLARDHARMEAEDTARTELMLLEN